MIVDPIHPRWVHVHVHHDDKVQDYYLHPSQITGLRRAFEGCDIVVGAGFWHVSETMDQVLQMIDSAMNEIIAANGQQVSSEFVNEFERRNMDL